MCKQCAVQREDRRK